MSAPSPGSSAGDLADPFEIAMLVRRFYRRVSADDLLGPIFNDVAQVRWPDHLRKLTAFWSRILLDLPGFDGAPMAAHARIHSRHGFTPADFERWIGLFFDTVDGGWSGPRAIHAKDVAASVARAHGLRLTGTPMSFDGTTPPKQTAHGRIGDRSRSAPMMPRGA